MRNFLKLAVQLLDFLSVPVMHKKHTNTPPTGSTQSYRVMFSHSAVWLADTMLKSTVHMASATLRPAHHFELLLRTLTTIQATHVLADACLPPSSHPAGLAPDSHAPKGNLTPAEAKSCELHKLVTWPWSIMGKEVSAPDYP
jgi:hypothetical protein